MIVYKKRFKFSMALDFFFSFYLFSIIKKKKCLHNSDEPRGRSAQQSKSDPTGHTIQGSAYAGGREPSDSQGCGWVRVPGWARGLVECGGGSASVLEDEEVLAMEKRRCLHSA